ncbi:MAG: ribosomal protein [Mycobacterium sp.]|jgi:large subunit ribosomal protein L10|nr:ribosomal protein [Mycobacterium sp.]
MARSDKTAAVAEIVDAFRGSSAAVLTEYRGLTVSQLTELRRSMGSSAKYTVVKNTLTKIAAQEAGLTGLDELLTGPTAVAFISGDPVEAAKGLRDFSKANPLLIIKGGVLDGAPITSAEINRLADLESREVLLAKLAGAMNGSLVKAVTLLSAPLSQAARLIEALRQQREANGESIPAAEAAPATDAAETAAETAPAEATAEAAADPAVDAAAESADAAPAASAE